MAIQMTQPMGAGSGSVGAVSGGIAPAPLFLVGFILGFFWSLRRSRRNA